MSFAGMFMGNNKQNNKFGILQCYYESYVYNTVPHIDNPNWIGGPRDNINFDNPVNKRYHTDCSRVIFNKERKISYWINPNPPSYYNNWKNEYINWPSNTINSGWICGIKWRDEIGSLTVYAEGSITWCRISDDGINWELNGGLNDNTSDNNIGHLDYTGGQTFAVKPTTRYFILGMTDYGGYVYWMQINPIIPNTEWIAPADNSLVKNIFAMRPGVPVSNIIMQDAKNSEGIDISINAFKETGKYINNNNITFLETINTGETSITPNNTYPYYHNGSSTPIDLIIEFTKPVWCNGFQYLYDINYGSNTGINEVNIWSSDTLHPSHYYIDHSSIYGSHFNDASWNIEDATRSNYRFGFPISHSGASNLLNPISLLTNINENTVLPFHDSKLEWLSRGPVRYVKISILSNLSVYNFLNENSGHFDTSYISIKHFSLKIADPDKIISLDTSNIRHISLNYTQFDENPIATGNDYTQADVYYQYNVNNGVHKPGLIFNFNNNGLLNSDDIVGAVPTKNWNNIIPLKKTNTESNTLEYPNNFSIKDNNGYLLGDILRHNSVHFDKEQYFNFGTNILFNGKTSFDGETIIDIPKEFQESGYVVRIYWGAFIDKKTSKSSWGIRVSDNTGYSKQHWIKPPHNAIYAEKNTPYFPLDGNDPYINTFSESVSGYYGSKHTGYHQSSIAGYSSNYSYYDNGGVGLTGAILTITGGGFSGIQITQKAD